MANEETVRPKTNVLIFKQENDRFAFGFNSRQERSMVQRGGPWLYNKQTLLVLEEANDVTRTPTFLLKFQEFWVQIKGLPFCHMMR